MNRSNFTLQKYRFLLIALFSCCDLRAADIAWFYALGEDLAAFEKLAGRALRSVTNGSVTMHHYQIGPHKICAAKMGSGCCVTANTAATCLALFPASHVISTGPAGGLHGNEEMGHWIAVNKVIAWQKGKATGGRIVSSESATQTLTLNAKDWPNGAWQQFPAAALASGEAFVCSAEMRDRIAADSGARAVEMNAQGLVSAVAGRAVKVLILRVISDHADESAEQDFSAFLQQYDGRGGALVYEIVKAMPGQASEAAGHESLKKLLDGIEDGKEP